MAQGVPFALLSIYADQPGVFGAAEVELLTTLAEILAYGITLLRAQIEQSQAQEQLHRVQEMAYLAAEAADVGSWEWDLQTNEVTWSNKLKSLFAIPLQQQVSYQLFLNTIHPEDRETIERAVGKALEQKADYRVEMRVVLPDGKIRWMASEGRPLFDATGKPVRMLGIAQDITVRKLREEELRESEDRFQLFVEHAPAGLAMLDREMRYLHVSRRWRADYGLGDRDVRGESHYELFREIPERWKEAHRRALAGEVVREENDRFDRADGSVQWVRWEIRPWHDKTGAVGGIVIFAEDITDRRRMEEEKQNLVEVAQNSPDFLGIAAPDGKVLFINKTGQALVGLESNQQATSKTIFDYLPPDEIARFGHEALSVVLSGKAWCGEVLFRHFRTGELIPVEMRGFPICDSHGKVIAIANISRDIRVRKQSEEALRRSEDRFHKAFRSSPLAITISTRAEGRYLDVNEAFLWLLGYQRRDVIGRTATELNFWIEPQHRLEMLRQLGANGRVTAFPTHYKTSKGEIREAEVSAELIDLEGQPCVLAITRDTTETQQLEAQFRQAQKMEAVGRLAGGLAHDFNNILGVIIGYSEVALGVVAQENPVNKHLAQIRKASDRAVSLTQQLLAFSRQQVVFPKALNLNEVVQNVSNMLLRMVGEDIAISFRPTTPIGSIHADPGQIEQILMNLVVNARDAMPSGGEIIIETWYVELDEHFTSQNPGSRAGQYVVLTVRDTGCGMDEKTKSHIFEPFFTTKEVGEGTGLGLSTVYGIVKQNGAYIRVYSELGKGTKFEIYFPKVAETSEKLGPSDEEAETPGGSETILVVEDDGTLRQLTVSMLQDAGYRVIQAEDAKTALGILHVSNPAIDLLLTDVIMPGESGVALREQAKRIHPNLRSLFMSGYPGDLVARRTGLMPEAVFLKKPFTRASLLKKVYSALRSESAKQSY